MAECYLCGVYVPRGEGFRRNVQTGTSHRIYVGRRLGGSSGVQFGTRTVCESCARMQDEREEGRVPRTLFFLVVCAVLAFFGFRALANGDLGMALVWWGIGPITWFIIERAIRTGSEITQWQAERSAELVPLSGNGGQAEAPETDDAAQLEFLSGFFSQGGYRLGFSAIREGESLDAWCARTADTFPYDALPVGAGLSRQDVLDLIVAGAEFRPPRPGEPVAVWFEEAGKDMHRVSALLAADPAGRASARQPNESHQAWVSRVGGALLLASDAANTAELITVLAGIADQVPPREGETFKGWFERVRPQIDAHNAQLDT